MTAARTISAGMRAMDAITVPAPRALTITLSAEHAQIARAWVAGHPPAALARVVRLDSISDWSETLDVPTDPREAVYSFAGSLLERGVEFPCYAITVDGPGREQRWLVTARDGDLNVLRCCDYCGEPHRGECAEAAYVHDVASGRVSK